MKGRNDYEEEDEEGKQGIMRRKVKSECRRTGITIMIRTTKRFKKLKRSYLNARLLLRMIKHGFMS